VTKEIIVKTEKRHQLIDITAEIEAIVQASRLDEGLVLIFTPHSTAGIIITEDESGLKEDWFVFLKKLVSGFDFAHNRIDNNADAHILSGLIGQSKAFIVKDGNLLRGTWQQIFLAEFDGPRERTVVIETIGK